MTAETAAATNTAVATEIVAAAASAIAAARPTIAGCRHPPPRWPRLAVYVDGGGGGDGGRSSTADDVGLDGTTAAASLAVRTPAAAIVTAIGDARGGDVGGGDGGGDGVRRGGVDRGQGRLPPIDVPPRTRARLPGLGQ